MNAKSQVRNQRGDIIGFLKLSALVCLISANGWGYELPTNHVANPVLIQSASGYGTGFYLSSSNAVFLVTAKHVLGAVGADKSLTFRTNSPILLTSNSRNPSETNKSVISVDLVESLKSNNFRLHNDRDIALIKIGTIDGAERQTGLKLTQGTKIVQRIPGSGIQGYDPDMVGSFQSCQLGQPVFVIGFPRVIGVEEQFFDPEYPVVRGGILSSKNHTKRLLILDCEVYGGNSGGPVVAVHQSGLGVFQYRLVGLVTSFVPYEQRLFDRGGRTVGGQLLNSGYSVAEPIDFVVELFW